MTFVLVIVVFGGGLIFLGGLNQLFNNDVFEKWWADLFK